MKYTFETKLKAVKLYENSGVYKYPKDCKTKKQRDIFANYVRYWCSVYQVKGEEGLKHKVNNSYSVEEKFAIITPILAGTISIIKQSRIVCVDSGTLYQWVKRYRNRGLEGLKCSKRGRPCKNMTEPNKEETNIENSVDDKKKIKELEHKVLLLEAENEYLKKLRALVEEKRRLNQKKNPQSSTHSTKAKNSKIK